MLHTYKKIAINGFFHLLCRYMTNEMVQPYRALGFEMKKSDSIDNQDFRAAIISWMCLLGYDDCKVKSVQLFANWMNSFKNEIDPSVRSTVYCQAIANGDEKEWNFLWNMLTETNNANEKKTILRALACTGEVWLLQRYLDMTIEPTSRIRKQDGSTVIANIAMNPVGRYIAWNWLRNRWNDVSTYFDTAISSAVGTIVKYVTKDFNTAFELGELQQFYQEHQHELGTAKRATMNAIESVKANVLWMENHYQEIKQWLAENVDNADFIE